MAATRRRLADDGAAVVVVTHDIDLPRELHVRALHIEDAMLVSDRGGKPGVWR